MPFARASSDELSAVRNILQDPLSGRKVMIPFTSKAFFEGSLQPSMAENKEQVIVKLSKKELVEMARTEAQKLLEERIEVLGKEKRITSVSNPLKKESKILDDPAPSMPYFEIREEYDEDGNEIRAEAINVAKELEYLQRKENENIDSAVRKAESQDMELLEQKQNETKTDVTNEEYEQISSRLEKLARLEEEAEAKQKINKASSQKLQGSGWGKGFLNRKKKSSVMNEVLTSRNKISKEKELPKQQSAKKVNFAETHESPEMQSQTESSLNNLTTMRARRPIESNVFSGFIKERDVGEQSKPSHRAEESTKKPLSLFAQRRLAQQH
mmetsp:Transcript_24790/g.36691  ORF Transcript_24790/g.36691 Transcript_24790/m.36691 type:complete len:327 (+) Transcript_24790:228-1208(+)|eukprot:CAMPEP_0194219874 /NCGR_PEP_ID=MMETSP0156-20130528/27041_1 /TAXON_ID=33649 /ORGANISM="Thalassionema nitzschioides, Strain L26-B" /LENGTH=326 /DNA_ID=CAMNT_0038949695 /DNA_START=158 /DNA_END=1138 /DNA_ORIENTATION=-